jgi:hypothetical protein
MKEIGAQQACITEERKRDPTWPVDRDFTKAVTFGISTGYDGDDCTILSRQKQVFSRQFT